MYRILIILTLALAVLTVSAMAVPNTSGRFVSDDGLTSLTFFYDATTHLCIMSLWALNSDGDWERTESVDCSNYRPWGVGVFRYTYGSSLIYKIFELDQSTLALFNYATGGTSFYTWQP
jgi:hypothetical protein